MAQLRAMDDAGELLVFASLQTHSLILGMSSLGGTPSSLKDNTVVLMLHTEVTALRTKITEMEQRLSSQEKLLMRRAMQQYNTLVTNLFSTSFSVKAQYEKYR